MDPNVHIQEVKAATCDIVPGPATARRRAARARRPPRPAAPGCGPGRTLRFRADDEGTTMTHIAPRQRPAHPQRRARPRQRGHPVRVLHRHLGVHRVQGLRGGVQGVEPGPGARGVRVHAATRWTTPASSAPTRWRHVAFVEQPAGHVPALAGAAPGAPSGKVGLEWFGDDPGLPAGAHGSEEAARGADLRRCRGGARRRIDRLPLADELGRVQALHRGGVPRGLPDRRDLLHRVLDRGRAGRRLQRLWVLRDRLPLRRHRAPLPRPARRRRRLQVHPVLRPDAGRAAARLRPGVPDRLDPVRAARGAAGAGRGASG